MNLAVIDWHKSFEESLRKGSQEEWAKSRGGVKGKVLAGMTLTMMSIHESSIFVPVDPSCSVNWTCCFCQSQVGLLV
jgi:hypothetical protein